MSYLCRDELQETFWNMSITITERNTREWIYLQSIRVVIRRFHSLGISDKCLCVGPNMESTESELLNSINGV
ncbi:hypothetical protein GWI33_014471 [Rhynchophorus ferrugineus]|uniref:Uncharacterized protein n=1 Tax=Rhynchophorus ferrugineus TaxID=354439 RepID=A0A834I1C1_RHYFE|nr:hypothetical protein GWI33_014471 [Rhynchophorus ferrugineus]